MLFVLTTAVFGLLSTAVPEVVAKGIPMHKGEGIPMRKALRAVTSKKKGVVFWTRSQT